ncbi:MAG: TIGR00282 family metallophosphoesterase [Bacillota bacterium]|jgi:metallophosphoesterase (TIGR00282 family)
MKILFIGDIVASPGRHIVEKNLPRLLEQYEIDFTIANGENSSGGAGMSRKSLEELSAIGVDAFTMGNHIWDNKEIFDLIDHDQRIVRPANFAPSLPGMPWRIYDLPQGKKLALSNIVGRIYMPPANCPFAAMDEMLKQVRDITSFIIVDFHAEATSEKMAMGWYLDGRISALLGTHTHIQTNDARILPRGTAYLTDVGMTGPRDSVLGVDKDIIIKKMLTQMPQRFEPARGDLQFNGVVIELGEDGKARTIDLINFFDPSL